jgi:hypothetical protein
LTSAIRIVRELCSIDVFTKCLHFSRIPESLVIWSEKVLKKCPVP